MRNDFNIAPYDNGDYVFIAAAPRSATQYIAHVFQAAGVDIQHEGFGERGISAFEIVPHLASRKNGLIVHQVREPLKAMASMQVIDRSWGYITDCTGISPRCGGKLHAVMQLWHLLNSHIEKYADFRYRVEDIDSQWPTLCRMLNVSEPVVPDVPRNTHTRKGKFRTLSWHELEFRDYYLTKCIKAMAIRYGYEVME